MTSPPAPRARGAAPGPGHLPELPDADTWRRWGIDPSWSQVLDVPCHAGGTRRWHLLDTGEPTDPEPGPVVTLLCVHGNPTWAYAWATFLRTLGARYRVVAVDQLGMGYSERTVPRRYVDRVRDLDDVIVALGLGTSGPLVIAAHDWGGAIAMGWVVQDPRQVAGLILCNTGIAVPAGRSAPGIIRLAASAPLLDAVCRGTRLFVEGTIRLSGRRLRPVDREAFRAPYRSAPDRAAIADFVADIPLHDGHPSEGLLDDVASRLRHVRAPVLLAWGARDPVFDDDFAADLADRFPNTRRHRFARAGHLVMAEADVASVAGDWLDDLVAGRLAPAAEPVDPAPPGEAGSGIADSGPLWSAVASRSDDAEEAFVDLASGAALSWSELAGRVESVAADLHRRGLQPGDRVAMLTPPGPDLVSVVYGVWRAGGVTVIADRGLGLRALGRAVRSTRPTWVIGPRRALAAAVSMRWAPRATAIDVDELIGASGGDRPPEPTGDDLAAILFTSGATGPPKGVRYLHRQLAAQRDALATAYGITRDDRLVAAFAPFSLYGPALGVTTALPDVDVTKPGQLTADALDAACTRIGATLAFASPAALANVVATAGAPPDGLAGLRMVLSAGAPVPSETLRAVAELAPHASLHTPYGMTEVLPVTDIELAEIEASEATHPGEGVCVGAPVERAEVRIVPLGFDPESVPDAVPPGEMGEILVRAAWVSDGYDGLWGTERRARPPEAWHRSGDVGHLDEAGRLWVEGRAVHVIHTAAGPVTSVPLERVVERALGRRPVAAVGVGPDGTQQVVVVVEDRTGSDGSADAALAAEVRSATEVPIAAVLTVRVLPVDIRHNAKIDRTAVADWAARLLAGRRPGRLR